MKNKYTTTRYDEVISLGEHTTIIHVQIFAINACVLENLMRNYNNRKILMVTYTLSDAKLVCQLQNILKHVCES